MPSILEDFFTLSKSDWILACDFLIFFLSCLLSFSVYDVNKKNLKFLSVSLGHLTAVCRCTIEYSLNCNLNTTLKNELAFYKIIC